MTTVQVELPDVLAQSAQAAGLLTPQALEAMLREHLKRQAGDALRAHLIVSGDRHLHSLGGNYQGVRIVAPAEAVGLLQAV